MDNITSALFSCFKEAEIFLKKLEASDNEHVWINYLDKLESKMGLDELEILQALKLLVMSCLSLSGLKHLMHAFLRKVSSLIDKLALLSDEEKALDTWRVVQNFWSLCANQHEQLTGMSHGYSAEFYQVLPSLASVYIDLFVAANRSKTKFKKLSKRLYGWLKFELNERCMKTALLEVSVKNPDGAKIISPILKKLLSQPPPLTSDSHLDYLLHFVLLKSWLPVCENLKEIAESSLNLKAPETFVAWLKENWAKSAEHLPEDKSFKGRRVSELLLDLDADAIEELVDVFSSYLWSLYEEKETPANLQRNDNLFTIDKTGNESQKVNPVSERSKKRKKRAKHASKIVDDDNNLETDYFMLDKSPPEVPEAKRRKTADDDGLLGEDNPDEEEEAMDFDHFDCLTKSSDPEVGDDLSVEVADQSVCFFLDRGAAKSADGQTGQSSPINVEVSAEAMSPCEVDQSGESEVEILKDNLEVSCLTLKKSPVKRVSGGVAMIDITGETHDDTLRIDTVSDSSESDDGDVEITLTSLKPKFSSRNLEDADLIEFIGDRVDIGKEIKDMTGSNKVVGNDDDIVLIASPRKGSPLKKVRRENDISEVQITNVEKRPKERHDDIIYVSQTEVRPSPLKKPSQDKVFDVEKTPEEINNDIVLGSPTKVRPSPLKKPSQDKVFVVEKTPEETNNDIVLGSPTKVRPSPLKKPSQDKVFVVEKTPEETNNDIVLGSPTKVRPSPLKKPSQDKVFDVEITLEETNNDFVLVSPTKVRPSPLKKPSQDKGFDVEITPEETNNDFVLVSPTKVRPSPLKKPSQDKVFDVEKTPEETNKDVVLVSPTKVRPSPLKKPSQDKVFDVEKTPEETNKDVVLVSPTKVRPSPLKKPSQDKVFDVEKTPEETNKDVVLVSPTKVRPSPLKKPSQDKVFDVEKTPEETNKDVVLVSPTKVRPSPLKKPSQDKVFDVEKTPEETNKDVVLVSPTKVRPSPLKKPSQDKVFDVEKTPEETNKDVVLVSPTKVRPSPLKKSSSPIKKVHKEKDTFETSTVSIENEVLNINQDISERTPTKGLLKEAKSDIRDSLSTKSDFLSKASPLKSPKHYEIMEDGLRSQSKDEKQKDAEHETVAKAQFTIASSQSPVKTDISGRNESPVKTDTSGSIESPVKTNTNGRNESPVKTNTSGRNESPVKTNISGRNESPVKTKISGSNESPVKADRSESTLQSMTVSSPPSNTEQQIGFMLAQMRKSVTILQEKPSRNMKTRLRTKSEAATQPEQKSVERSKEFLSDWLRKPSSNMSQKSADPGDGSPGKTDPFKKLVSAAVSTRQSPRYAGKSDKESSPAMRIKATPDVLLTRALRNKSLKDGSLGGGGDSLEESTTVQEKKNKSPLHPSPLTRSYLLRRKQLDGKCEVCSQDSECSMHTAEVTSESAGTNSPKKTLKRMKLKSSSTQSSLSPSRKRKAATPKV